MMDSGVPEVYWCSTGLIRVWMCTGFERYS